MDSREKMLGSWQLGLHSGGRASPFKREFLTGQVAPVLVLRADHLATYGIPCEINETLHMKINAIGRWDLSEEGHFTLPQMIQGDDVSIMGRLRTDEESDEIDHLVVDRENERLFQFGRFDQGISCAEATRLIYAMARCCLPQNVGRWVKPSSTSPPTGTGSSLAWTSKTRAPGGPS